METTSLPVRSSPERAAELFELIKSFRIAQDAGDQSAALRLIDRAWRIASKNPEINYLYGLWLVTNGSAKAALSLLETATANGNDPNVEAVYISALCADGSVDLAQERLQNALACFAVAPDSPMENTARQVVTAFQPQVAGWIGLGPNLKLRGEIFGEHGKVPLRISLGKEAQQDLVVDCGDQPFAAFNVEIDGPTAAGPVQAHVHDLPLLGSALILPPDFGLDGRVTTFDGGISGWAGLRWDPARPLEITLSNEQGYSAHVMANPDPLSGRHYFTFNAKIAKLAGNSIAIAVSMPDGVPAQLPGSPFLARPAPAPHTGGGTERQPGHLSKELTSRREVDIVIPVYDGLDETLNCIKSVQRTTGPDTTIVVIEDASPDPRIIKALDALARAGVITLLRNPINLGFPATVNRGLARDRDRDVIILNADTEVYEGWLDRLRAAAYSSPDIGTVTPLTNSGSIASYPTSEAPALNSETAAERSALAAQVNNGVAIDIPTGVGFCLYIRRDCIAGVGLFDTDTFSRGYGEENDFCLRATALGWRHILAGDTFVRHIGSRSFGGLRAALFERNIRLLNLRFPGYDTTIKTYSDADPAHNLRRRMDDARLTGLNAHFALLVTLDPQGGVRRAVDERATQLKKEGITPVVLKPDPERVGRCILTLDAPMLEDLYFDREEYDQLIGLLGRLKLDHIEIHHILDLPGDLIDQLYSLGCPVDIQVHDYIWYCPRINLLDQAGRYCGEPAIAGCRACIRKNGSLFKEDVEVGALRERSTRWLHAARYINVPTQGVAKRMAVHFPKVTFNVEPLEVSPLPASLAPQARKNLKIAVIGAIGAHKGFDTLLDMAKDAVARNLPLDFVVIGYTQDDKALFDTGRVFVTGEYEEYEVEQLIARESPDVALFLSQFPETWSYTLSHALNAGIPVAGYDFGAIGDRLGQAGSEALLFPRSTTASELCDRLLAAFHPSPTDQFPAVRATRRGEASSRHDKADILITKPVPQIAVSSRKDMATTSNLPSASVEFLPLSQGLFLFSVKSTQQPYQVDEQTGILLPAIQLSSAPGIPAGQIEFMLSPRTSTAWLSYPHDQIVVRVSAPSSLVLLTSVIIPGMTPLEIEVQRLDRVETTTAIQLESGAVPAVFEPPPLPAMRPSIPIKIVPHVQNHGDLEFSEGQWAGLPGERLWIESFSILPLAELTPDMIEYKAVTATGVETHWVSDGLSCGTRGIGVPLIGIAVRIRPQAGVENGVSEYGAVLLSGRMLGPARNGMPCRSPDPNDPICGIWVSLSGKSPLQTNVPEPAATNTSKSKKSVKSADETPAPSKATTPGAEKTKAPIGPRFSGFREQNNSEQE